MPAALNGVDLTDLSQKGLLVEEHCKAARSNCPTAFFTCQRTALSDGLAQVQRHIRANGAVMTSLMVTRSFKSYFAVNRTGIFNDTAVNNDDEDPIQHAVLLVGELLHGCTIREQMLLQQSVDELNQLAAADPCLQTLAAISVDELNQLAADRSLLANTCSNIC